MTAELDHLVVGAATLEAGAEAVERLLGVRPSGGGRHEGAGTHNLLLGLGPGAYLEVIAPDPQAPTPARPRLFGLDDQQVRRRIGTGPTLLTWVARTRDLDAALAGLGPSWADAARAMSRGGLSWRLATPPLGEDLAGLVPGLIQWDGAEAAGLIADPGCRLLALEAEHPRAGDVLTVLRRAGAEALVTLRDGPAPRLTARIRRADGRVVELSADPSAANPPAA
ncbi:VOC family protein [Roseomonas sp. CCTCC AB2023176]|uniref:VOC family protein n=1 Tax=Roseomonas sp. CCTCC AB2023176 TaxID=3342640 RepID=UPI0035D6B729